MYACIQKCVARICGSQAYVHSEHLRNISGGVWHVAASASARTALATATTATIARRTTRAAHPISSHATPPARTHFGALTGNGGLGDGRGRGRARGLRLAPDHMERGPDAVSRPGALSKQARRARPALQQDHEVPRHCHNNKRKHTHVQKDMHDTGSQTTWGF
jgi:hypothetical protein